LIHDSVVSSNAGSDIALDWAREHRLDLQGILK
jgi:hypothetical protein